jgi:peptide/nickel transport system permease protein
VLSFIGRRIVHLVIVLLLVSLAASYLLDLTPGDPALAIIGETATPEQIAVVHKQLGLDKPFIVRYAKWVGKATHGDLGSSFRTKQPVWQAIHERLPVTIELAILTVFFSLLIAIPLGIISAYRQGGWLDKVTRFTSSASLSSPNFLTALVLVFFFAVTWRIFPVTGWVPISQSLGSNLDHVFLPVTSLVLLESAVFLRLLRSDMISTLQEDYVLAARAKGLPTWHILLRHALRPSSFSLITIAGISFGRVLGGTVIVETLFALPGIGLYVIQAIYNKDLIAVQGTVLFVAAFYVLINAAIELSYAWLDPRVRVRHA